MLLNLRGLHIFYYCQTLSSLDLDFLFNLKSCNGELAHYVESRKLLLSSRMRQAKGVYFAFTLVFLFESISLYNHWCIDTHILKADPCEKEHCLGLYALNLLPI